jgi:hypothetical protein
MKATENTWFSVAFDETLNVGAAPTKGWVALGATAGLTRSGRAAGLDPTRLGF